jgi:RNA polymerase sigma factor (sigma-70 family)
MGLLTPLVREFEDRIWVCSPGQLAGWLSDYSGRRRVAGVGLSEILAEQTDELLAVCIRKGLLVKEAYRELIWERYSRGTPRLADWFGRIGRSYGHHVPEDSIEELVQDLHLRLCKCRLENYDPELGAFEGYLYRIAHRLFLDTLRRRRLQPLPEGCEPEGPEDVELFAAELAEEIRTLPGDEQSVLEGLLAEKSVGEIAEELGRPIQHVYRLRDKARKRLARRWSLASEGVPGLLGRCGPFEKSE